MSIAKESKLKIIEKRNRPYIGASNPNIYSYDLETYNVKDNISKVSAMGN